MKVLKLNNFGKFWDVIIPIDLQRMIFLGVLMLLQESVRDGKHYFRRSVLILFVVRANFAYLCISNVLFAIHYRAQRRWGKVIFSQASVILLTGRVPAPGGSGPSASGGVSAPGGCARWSPPFPGTATAAGGTHPTGVHSCL